MSTLSIQRVIALPAELDPSTLYIVRGSEATLAELYFSGNTGSEVRHLINKAEISAMIAAASLGGGGSGTADSLTTPRTISATGDAAWSVTFDGSADATSVLTLTATGVAAGEYPVVTVDTKGRVTAARALIAADIPSLPGSKINSALTVDTSGNAGTATKLATPRNINGVAFDGSADITVNAVDATERIAVTEKGAINGVATLDASGRVPAAQLPSYVDGIQEAADLASLPAVGEVSVIYVALDTNKIYRWSGATYLEISPTAGTADAATKLATPRNIAATGDATWSASFDGSADVSSALTLAATGIAAGTYPVLTVDTKGRATAGRALIPSDIPSLDYTTVSSAASINLGASEW